MADATSPVQLGGLAGTLLTLAGAAASDMVRCSHDQQFLGLIMVFPLDTTAEVTTLTCAQVAQTIRNGVFHCGNWGELRCVSVSVSFLVNKISYSKSLLIIHENPWQI